MSDESNDLRAALLIVPLALFVSALFWLGGFFTLPSDAPFCKSRCCRRGINKIKKTAGIDAKVLPLADPPEAVVTRGSTPALPQQDGEEQQQEKLVEQQPTTTTTEHKAKSAQILLDTLPVTEEQEEDEQEEEVVVSPTAVPQE